MARTLPYSLEEVMHILLSSLASKPDPRFEEVRLHLESAWQAWCGGDELAKDAAQETWAKMLSHGFENLERLFREGRFSSLRGLEGYLFLAFRNQWFDLLRARKHAPESRLTEPPYPMPLESPPAEELARRREIVASLHSFIETLDATDRSIFYEHFMEDCSDQDIARRLSLSRSAVASKLKRWRRRLRERLADHLGDSREEDDA